MVERMARLNRCWNLCREGVAASAEPRKRQPILVDQPVPAGPLRPTNCQPGPGERPGYRQFSRRSL